MERDNLQSQSIALINENKFLSAKLQEAYSAITKIIQAIGLLKYDFNYSPDYKIQNLSPKQSTMIDALANYGARLAEKNNFPEQADAMLKNIALDVEVKNEMRKISPNIFGKQQKSYDYER